MGNQLDSTKGIIKAVKYFGEEVIITLYGEIDMKCSGKMKEQLEEILSHKPACIIVDMAGVGFMDSSGLAVLVGTLKQARDIDCCLRISGMSEEIHSIFEICRLESIFEIYDNIAEAL